MPAPVPAPRPAGSSAETPQAETSCEVTEPGGVVRSGASFDLILRSHNGTSILIAERDEALIEPIEGSSPGQTSMSEPAPWDAARARRIIDGHQHLEGPVLPILHALQAEFGCVPAEAVPLVAERLDLSRAEVHGVVTFYHDFRRAPAGRHVIAVCRAEACQARGGRDVEATFRRLLGLDWQETSADGRVTLEPVYCLGLCATGPAALVDGEPVARLDEAGVREIVTEVAR